MTGAVEDIYSLELDLEALNEVRKTLSITMTKLESKLQNMSVDSRVHVETARAYLALKRAYGEVMAAIEEAMNLDAAT